MNFQNLLSWLGPIYLLFLGIMTRFSNNDGWSSSKKYWLYLIIMGLILLICNVYNYFFTKEY